ncbi:MAG: hypothetical protein ABJA67_03245 [Chthonomonadales bacterium]
MKTEMKLFAIAAVKMPVACLVMTLMVSGCDSSRKDYVQTSQPTPPNGAKDWNTIPQTNAPSPPPPQPQVSQISTAETMVIIDAGSNPPPTDRKVRVYQDMLDSLLVKYGGSLEHDLSSSEREHRIGEVIATVSKSLKEKGVRESLLNIGLQIDAQFDLELSKKTPLATAAAIYVVDKTRSR